MLGMLNKDKSPLPMLLRGLIFMNAISYLYLFLKYLNMIFNKKNNKICIIY